MAHRHVLVLTHRLEQVAGISSCLAYEYRKVVKNGKENCFLDHSVGHCSMFMARPLIYSGEKCEFRNELGKGFPWESILLIIYNTG